MPGASLLSSSLIIVYITAALLSSCINTVQLDSSRNLKHLKIRARCVYTELRSGKSSGSAPLLYVEEVYETHTHIRVLHTISKFSIKTELGSGLVQVAAICSMCGHAEWEEVPCETHTHTQEGRGRDPLDSLKLIHSSVFTHAQ